MLSIPDATASSTLYWMIGLSTSGSISFGCALVAGRNRVPRPAAGKTALRTVVTGGIVSKDLSTCDDGGAVSRRDAHIDPPRLAGAYPPVEYSRGSMLDPVQ